VRLELLNAINAIIKESGNSEVLSDKQLQKKIQHWVCGSLKLSYWGKSDIRKATPRRDLPFEIFSPQNMARLGVGDSPVFKGRLAHRECWIPT
jgi:hypothetical protein